MKLGMIVRADDRGLGNQSWEAWRHLTPEATVIIADGNSPLHVERYDYGTPVVPFSGGGIDRARILETFADCTHVYSAETFYDWQLVTDLRERGIKTVVQLNPELFPHAQTALPHPDAWWNPTSWRMAELPYTTRLVPVPVALGRFAGRPRVAHDRPRILHVVGRPALADRNGTKPFLESLQYLEGVNITVTYQGPNHFSHPRLGAGSSVKFVQHDGPYWTLYDDQDILVLPRRYGGLCLPVQEALAAGLVVVMSDIMPQAETWPIVGIYAHEAGLINTPTGLIDTFDCDPAHVAIKTKEAISRLDEKRPLSKEWAIANSWAELYPLYMSELGRV